MSNDTKPPLSAKVGDALPLDKMEQSVARLVYACRFEVLTTAGLDEVVIAYRDWVVDHYRDRRKIANFSFEVGQTGKVEFLPDRHGLSSSKFSTDAGNVASIRWSFPDENDAGLRWINDIRVGQFGDRCSVEHLISIESVDYNIAPARLMFGSPRVVREICSKTPAYVGDMEVLATPYALHQNGLENLLTLLLSDLRRLPVVVLSAYARGEPNLIDPIQLARNLAGVAVVVKANDPEVTLDLTDEIGRQLSCFNGAARIYWPGFSRSSDPHSHRLFLGAWIGQVGSTAATRAIERTVFAVAAFRFVPDPRISDVIRAVETAERQKQLSAKKAAGDEFWEDYERDLARLDEARRKVEELEAENANLRANQQVLITGSFTPGEPTETAFESDLSFSTVVAAIEAAAKRSANVEFLDSAYASAAESPFQKPSDIFEALCDLNEIVDAWRQQRAEKGSGGDLLQHLRNRGWGKRSSMHISDTTRGKFRAHYEFLYQGKRQLFEPHITIGAGDSNSCASIHFIFDQGREKMIVGHVGRHLPNTKI